MAKEPVPSNAPIVTNNAAPAVRSTSSGKSPTVGQLLLNQKDQIAAALPKHFDVDRMTRLALTELNKNADLKACDPVSFLGALIQCSQLGLEPGSGLGHAYLIPFAGKVTLIVGYQGMIDLALRSGKVDTIFAEVAFEGDDFRYWIEDGLQRIKHEPVFSGARTPDRAKVVYACARIKGVPIYAVMSAEEIEVIEKENRKGKGMSAVWQKHWLEMAKKTVIRRLYKILPKSVEMADAYAYTATEHDGPNLRKLAEDALDLPPLAETKTLDDLVPPGDTAAN